MIKNDIKSRMARGEIRVEHGVKVSVFKLHSALHLQRKIDDKHISKMNENYFEGLNDPIKVSCRDGEYRVVGGQHRVSLKRLRIEDGLDDETKVNCIVAYGMTDENEAEWFDLEATREKSQSVKAVYESRLIYDVDFQNLVKTLEDDCGLTFNLPSIKNDYPRIDAIVSVENIYNSMDKKTFIDCFSTISSVWHGEPDSIRGHFIKGIVKFYNTYGAEINQKRIKAAFQSISAKSITNDVNNDKSVYEKSVKYSIILCNYYNKKLRKDKKLNMMKLIAQ